jgi:hypothetical protein
MAHCEWDSEDDARKYFEKSKRHPSKYIYDKNNYKIVRIISSNNQ